MRCCIPLAKWAAVSLAARIPEPREAIEQFTPEVVLAVGIAFGVNPKEQQIGAVLVSKQLQGYEQQRFGKDAIIPFGDRVAGSSIWLQRVRAATNKNRRRKGKWPEVYFGLMLSGEILIDNDVFRDAIVQITGGKAIGGEMEGAGLSVAAQEKNTDWLIIKGICDWANDKGINKDNRQKFAASNAAAIAKLTINPKGTMPTLTPLEGEWLNQEAEQASEPTNGTADSFQAGMTQDSPFYIERDADSEALNHFRNRGIMVAIKGVAGSGKSLMAQRLKLALAIDGWRGVEINVEHEFATADFATGHSFLLQLAKKIATKIGATEAALDIFRNDSTPSAFEIFLQQLLPNQQTKRLLIILDRLDAIAGKDCCSEVLSGLRLVHDSQKQLEAEHCVKMLSIQNIKPQIIEIMAAVFKIAKVVDVGDFSEGDIAELASRYRLLPLNTAMLHKVLGGNPHLSNIVLNRMAQKKISLESIIILDQPFFIGDIFRHHLDQLWSDFCKAGGTASPLRKAAQTLLKGGTLSSEEHFDILLALGIVRGGFSGDAVPRCGLYSAFLTDRLR